MEANQQHLEFKKKKKKKKGLFSRQTKSVIFSISFKTAVKNVLFRKTAASH